MASSQDAPFAPVTRFTVVRLQARARRRFVLACATLLGAVALALLLVGLLQTTGVLLSFVLLGGPPITILIAAWIWKRPIRGLYVLLAATVTLEQYYNTTAVDGYYIAHYLVFFPDFASYTSIHIVVSLGELFMTLVLIVWTLRAVAERRFHIDRGSMMLPIGLYMVMILVSEFRGLGTGGVLSTSLWEIRGQIYMFVSYLLTCNLVKTRKEVHTLTWILLAGTGVRAAEGAIRYVLIYRRGPTSLDLFPHEQAFFLNVVITLTAIFFLYGTSHSMKRFALVFLPLVIIVDVASDRRAAVLALGASMTLLLLVTLVVKPIHRKKVASVIVLLALLFPAYYIKYQYSYGSIGAPARAIASNFHPDIRDAASNQYRSSEDADIMATVRSNTTTSAIGYGFGKTMMVPYALPDISQIYVFWNIMPHNSVLWIWMRLGTIGYLLFWFMIGTAIVQAIRLTRQLKDSALQGLALFIALALVQEVCFGYLDLQWTTYRNLIMVGVLFGLLSRLRLIGLEEGSIVADSSAAGEAQRSSAPLGSLRPLEAQYRTISRVGPSLRHPAQER